jgi:hypothetical protein
MTAAAGLPGQQGTPEETARFVIGTAVLAPSVHNTQPWRFAVRPGRSACTPTRTGGWRWPTRSAGRC